MNNKNEKEKEDKQRMDQLETTIQGMTQTAIKRDQTIRSLQEELDKIKKEKTGETHEQRSILILGDSNAHSIHPHLNQGDNNIKYEIQPTYTMKQLEERVSEIKREETRTILIHTGTNDIRHGEKASEVMAKLKTATKKLEGRAEVVVAQVPPVYYGEDANDTRRKRVAAYNTLISDHFGDRTIITSDLENDLQYIGTDKLHLTEEGNKKSAQIIQNQMCEILKHIKKDGRKEPRKHEEKNDRGQKEATITVRTNKENAARIIGKDGDRVRSIKKKHKVNIDTEHLDSGERLFKIQGEETSAMNARDEIEDIIKQTEQDNKEKDRQKSDRRSNTTCRNYMKTGKCSWGNRCLFVHRKGPLDISLRSPPREDRKHHSDRREKDRPDMRPHPQYHREKDYKYRPKENRSRSPSREEPKHSRRRGRDEDLDLLDKISDLVHEVKRRK